MHERGERGHAGEMRSAIDVGADQSGPAGGPRRAGEPGKVAVLAQALQQPHATRQPGVAGVAPGTHPGQQQTAGEHGDRKAAVGTGKQQPGADQPQPTHVGQPVGFDVPIGECSDHPLRGGERGEEEHSDKLHSAEAPRRRGRCAVAGGLHRVRRLRRSGGRPRAGGSPRPLRQRAGGVGGPWRRRMDRAGGLPQLV